MDRGTILSPISARGRPSTSKSSGQPKLRSLHRGVSYDTAKMTKIPKDPPIHDFRLKSTRKVPLSNAGRPSTSTRSESILRMVPQFLDKPEKEMRRHLVQDWMESVEHEHLNYASSIVEMEVKLRCAW